MGPSSSSTCELSLEILLYFCECSNDIFVKRVDSKKQCISISLGRKMAIFYIIDLDIGAEVL